MDNLNPDDESVIQTTQKLIINGVSHKGVLRGSRLILIDAETNSPRITIPYPAIELAAAGTNRLREPVIRFTYTSDDGSARGVEIIFIFLAGGMNVQNRDRCLAALERQGVPVRHDTTHADFHSLSKRDRMDAGTLDAEMPQGRPAVPEWTVYGPAQGGRQWVPEEPHPVSPIVTLAAVIILAAILIAAMVTPLPEPSTPSWSKTMPAGKTMSATPVPTPTPAATQAAVTGAGGPSGTIPGNGIWVKISYPGQYAGFLSASGWRSDVNSSGTQWYQLPVQNTVIDGFIAKGDGSAERLEVGTYNGGTLIAQQGTSVPRGIVEMHVAVGPAVVNDTHSGSGITTVPALVTQTPVQEPVQPVIPTSGVWVHVAYPGNYTGTLSANGRTQEIDAAGDQIVQLVMKNGNIDGILEKADGSAGRMEIVVYNDGSVVSIANTSAPRGVVEIHTKI
jgi:hypothetical protein